MLYAGHFVFETYDGEKRIGYFNLMVDAADVATAKICFRNRLALLRQQTDLFSGSIRIFLDGIVEFRDIPQEVILTNYRTFMETRRLPFIIFSLNSRQQGIVFIL